MSVVFASYHAGLFSVYKQSEITARMVVLYIITIVRSHYFGDRKRTKKKIGRKTGRHCYILLMTFLHFNAHKL